MNIRSAKSLAFAMALTCGMAAAETIPQKATFTILSDTLNPIANAKLRVVVTKGDVRTGFFSNSVTNTAVTLDCTSDASGVCSLDAFLTAFESSGTKYMQMQIESLVLPTGPVEIRKPKVEQVLPSPVQTIEKKIYVEGGVARVGDERFAMTVSSAKAAIRVMDDEMETDILLDTMPALALYSSFYEHYRKLTTGCFLRAWLPKSGGAARFQVYSQVQYTTSNGLSLYQTVNYLTPTGPKKALLTRIDSSVQRDPMYGVTHNDLSRYEHTEVVGLEISEVELRDIIGGFKSGSDRVWKLRLSAKNGETTDMSIPMFVIAGLLERTDELRQGLR